MLLPMGGKISLVWTWVIAVVAATRTVVESSESLHPSSKICANKTTTLHCNVTDNTKEYRLENFKWESIQKVIIHNASHLILEEPLCINQTMEVEVYNSDRVTTERGQENCWQQLALYNSRDVTIEDGINLVRMFSSEARKIVLPLGSFHLQDSQVAEADMTVDTGTSTMTNSTIQVVKGLVVKGSAVLSVENSSLGRLERFIYDSLKEITLKNVTVDSVASHGFAVHNGVLTLDNTIIKSVESLGLLVVQGAELILQDCEIETTVYDSILVNEGGTISFKNVTIGQHREIFFTFSNVFGPLYPMAFLGKRSISQSGWVAIAVVVGATVGAVMGLALIVVQQRLKASKFKTDTTEHTQHTTSQNALSPNLYKHIGQFTPTPPTGSPSKKQWVDGRQGPPIELVPIAPMTQRPLVPLPHESSALTVTPQNLSKPNTVIEFLNMKEKDERDVLPLPPPPPPPAEDEELYDDVQASVRPGGKFPNWR